MVRQRSPGSELPPHPGYFGSTDTNSVAEAAGQCYDVLSGGRSGCWKCCVPSISWIQHYTTSTVEDTVSTWHPWDGTDADLTYHSEPLSDVPIDLLFLHFILPYTMHYFRPKKALTKVVVFGWKWLAMQLRLTSYMFGGRHPLEEITPIYSSWKSFAISAFGSDPPEFTHDGTFRRVPASDNVALPREMRATAEVNAEGEPISEAAARLIQMQNMEADKAKRNVKSDYTLVYIPPHFRYRIIAFIAALWTAFAIFVACVLSMPILLGRRFFKLFTSRDVHDGYSFITGFYLLWGCYIIGKAIDRMDKRRQRRGSDGPRPVFSVFLVKRSLLWLAKISYMVFFLGIVTPILIALVIEFYVVLPIRLAVKPDLKPHVRIVDAWALGLLYAKIGIQAHRLQNPTPMMRGLNTVSGNILSAWWSSQGAYIFVRSLIMVGPILTLLRLQKRSLDQ